MLIKIYSEVLNGKQSYGVLLTDGGKKVQSVTKRKDTVSDSGVDSNGAGKSLVIAF